MATRSEYEDAKKKYHHLGKTLSRSTGSARTGAKKLYEAAKKTYHSLGRQIAKKGK